MCRIVIAGDILPSGKNMKLFEEGNAKGVFGEKIIDLFSKSDFSIVNLEGPLTSSNNAMVKTGPVIKASKECIHGFKGLGVKAVALANNHITDFLQEGFEDTVKLLDDNGIDYLGAGKNVGDIKKSISLSLGGKKICIYNVSEVFYNRATDTSPGANLYDEYVVCNDIKELKKTHDYLIVIYHGGTEEFQYPTPMLYQHFHRMADCGADFITAQHTHCIGCCEQYNGSYLLYGQGNFLFARMKNDLTRHGLVTEIVFSDNGVDVIQHVVSVLDDDTVEYDDPQDLSLFAKRSDELNRDLEGVVRKYQKFCYNRVSIKDRFLTAFQGNSRFTKLLKRMPRQYYKKKVLENYNKEQLMRIAKCLESERYAEDMFACVQFMMDSSKKTN